MEIYKKLLEAKKEMEAITKDSKNPFFKSNYFDINKLLSEVEPILQNYGLLLLQPIQEGNVKTVIFDVDTNEKVSSEICLPSLNDPQKLGSAITYYRRYTLQSLLGLQAEDDDGNAAKPNNNDRLPALTADQYAQAIHGTKNQILNVLGSFRMSAKEREELTKLAKDGRK